MGRLEVRILISLSCRLFAYEQLVIVAPSNYLRLIASDRVKSVAEESRDSGREESGRAGSGSVGPDEVLSQYPAAGDPKAQWTPPQKSGGRSMITSIRSKPKSFLASGHVKSAVEESRENGRAGSGSAGPDEVLSQNPAAESSKAQWKAEALFQCICFILRGSYLTEFCA